MSYTREIIACLTRRLVVKRRLPSDFGRTQIYVAADAALGYLKPTLPGQDLFRIVREFIKPGSRVWDVGANVGLFAFAAGRLAGPSGEVVAIEADVWLASLLLRSRDLPSNEGININIVPVAASDRNGIARFLIAKRGRASNTLEQSGFRSQAGGTRNMQFVPTITLDSLLDTFQPPNFLKIDVEGAEELVLSGASRVLAEHRPIIYCEVGIEQNNAVTRLLKHHNYAFLHEDNGKKTRIDACCFNTLAIPNESIEQVLDSSLSIPDE